METYHIERPLGEEALVCTVELLLSCKIPTTDLMVHSVCLTRVSVKLVVIGVLWGGAEGGGLRPLLDVDPRGGNTTTCGL